MTLRAHCRPKAEGQSHEAIIALTLIAVMNFWLGGLSLTL